MPLLIIRIFQQAVYSLTLLLVNERHCLHFAIDQRLGLSLLLLFTSTPNNHLIDFEVSPPLSIIRDIQIAVLLIIN